MLCLIATLLESVHYSFLCSSLLTFLLDLCLAAMREVSSMWVSNGNFCLLLCLCKLLVWTFWHLFYYIQRHWLQFHWDAYVNCRSASQTWHWAFFMSVLVVGCQYLLLLEVQLFNCWWITSRCGISCLVMYFVYWTVHNRFFFFFKVALAIALCSWGFFTVCLLVGSSCSNSSRELMVKMAAGFCLYQVYSLT